MAVFRARVPFARVCGIVATVVVLAVVTACGGGSSAEPEPGGVTPFAVPAAGFSIGVPTGWRGVDKANAQQALDDALAADPDLKAIFESLTSETSAGIQFVAVAPDKTDGFTTNANVVTEPLPDGMNNAAYFAANQDLIKSLFAVDPEATTVTLPAGEAGRLEYTRKDTGGRELRQIQYFLTDADTGYVMTFTTVPDAGSKYDAVFQESAESFRLL